MIFQIFWKKSSCSEKRKKLEFCRSDNTLRNSGLKTKESTDFSGDMGVFVLTIQISCAIILKAFQAEAGIIQTGRTGKRLCRVFRYAFE